MSIRPVTSDHSEGAIVTACKNCGQQLAPGSARLVSNEGMYHIVCPPASVWSDFWASAETVRLWMADDVLERVRMDAHETLLKLAANAINRDASLLGPTGLAGRTVVPNDIVRMEDVTPQMTASQRDRSPGQRRIRATATIPPERAARPPADIPAGLARVAREHAEGRHGGAHLSVAPDVWQAMLRYTPDRPDFDRYPARWTGLPVLVVYGLRPGSWELVSAAGDLLATNAPLGLDQDRPVAVHDPEPPAVAEARRLAERDSERVDFEGKDTLSFRMRMCQWCGDAYTESPEDHAAHRHAPPEGQRT